MPHFGDLVLAARDVFIERDVELLDQVRPVALDEPWHVFREVLAGFRHEIPGALQDFVADLVPLRLLALGQHFLDRRVEILTVALKGLVEGHVVDAGAGEVDIVDRDIDVPGEFASRSLHAVTESNGGDVADAADRPAVHRHRIDIVEEERIRADLLHILHDVDQNRDRAQTAHDSADPESVGDRLPQPVLLRDLEIDHGAWLVATDLDHRNHIVGVAQGFLAIECGFDRGRRVHRSDQLGGNDFGGGEAFRIDVDRAQSCSRRARDS